MFYEAIEAWDFGPVVPEVYHEFKIFGGGIFLDLDVKTLKKQLLIWIASLLMIWLMNALHIPHHH